jgi:hypothetical protein
MRAELWSSKSDGNVAVGYRFELDGRWAESVETLDDRESSEVPISRQASYLTLDTLFTDRSGSECGRRRIGFLKGTGELGLDTYLIDDSNIGDLLRLVAYCAAKVR